MTARQLCLGLVLSVAMAVASAPAQAEDASRRSVEKANAGLSLYEHGKWEEALRAFREAESLYHSPVYLVYAARTLGRTGRWREARREYDRLLSEALPADAPGAWRKAMGEARAERDTLERDIPSVVVEVTGGSATTRITVDGERVSAGQPVQLDPGAHEVRAADGDRRATRQVSLQAGQKAVRVMLRLPAARPVEPERRSASIPGLVLSGVGGAAVLAGGLVGFWALSDAASARDDFPESCAGTTCPASRRPEIEAKTESARTLGSISNGLLIGGGLVLATGVVLLLVNPGAKAKPSANAAAATLRF